jgi:hypothetical protein
MHICIIPKPPLDKRRTKKLPPVRRNSYLFGVKICPIVKRLPAEVLKFFKEQGAKGGRIGGKRSLQTMTAEQRAARARKASRAAAAARKAKTAKANGAV